MKRSVLMKLTACCMTGAIVLGSTGVVTMASGLDSALAGMGAEIADSQQQKEVVKVAPTGYDTVAIAQVDEYVNIRDAAAQRATLSENFIITARQRSLARPMTAGTSFSPER